MFRGLANQLLSSRHSEWSNGYKKNKNRKEPITNLLKNISTRRQSLMEVSWIAGLSFPYGIGGQYCFGRCGLTNSFVNLNRPLSFRVPPPRWEITDLDYSDPQKTYPLILKSRRKPTLWKIPGLVTTIRFKYPINAELGFTATIAILH